MCGIINIDMQCMLICDIINIDTRVDVNWHIIAAVDAATRILTHYRCSWRSDANIDALSLRLTQRLMSMWYIINIDINRCVNRSDIASIFAIKNFSMCQEKRMMNCHRNMLSNRSRFSDKTCITFLNTATWVAYSPLYIRVVFLGAPPPSAWSLAKLSKSWCAPLGTVWSSTFQRYW